MKKRTLLLGFAVAVLAQAPAAAAWMLSPGNTEQDRQAVLTRLGSITWARSWWAQ